jgi:hypothetical protein
MEPDTSLPYSQNLITDPYPEPDEYISHLSSLCYIEIFF